MHDAFIDALNADEVLTGLFPDDDEEKGRIRSHRPSSVAHQLLNAALWRCAYEGEHAPDRVLAHLRSGLHELRELACGRETQARVWVGFGIELPGGSNVRTPFGIIRNWSDEHRLVLQSVADSTNPPPERGAVLESTTSVQWGVLSSSPAGSIACVGLQDERWMRLALAMLLFQDPATARPVQPWFCCQAQALASGIVSSEVRQFVKGPVVEHDALDGFQRWIASTTACDLDTIAVNRAVSMVSRQSGDVDALIDGVIVWENLFGTGDKQELGYRVSLNMACVLTDDRSERLDLQQLIKKLYDERSRIVHGGKHPNPSEARELRRQVQELTLRALQRVVAVHPNLASADPSSFTRFVLTDAY